MRSKLVKRTVAVLLTCIYLVLLVPMLYAAPAMGKYVHQEFFASDYSMTGLFDTTGMNFNSGTWELHEAVFTLCFSVTPLIHFDVSNFSLSLNGQRFYSSRLPQTKGQAQQLEISIPVDLIKQGSNWLEIESYIRTNDSEACTDDISSASWMTVFSDTSVSISYTPAAKIQSVSELYDQFTSVDALENNQSAVFVPPGASDTELTAAAMILSGISANAATGYESISLDGSASEAAITSKKYAIYITRYNKMLPSISALLTSQQVQAVQDGEALLSLVKLKDDCNVLVITANDAGALINAARLLGNRNYMLQIKADWRKLSSAEDVTFTYDLENATRKLTENGTYVHGPFRQEAQFYVQSYPNRVLKTGSAVSLSYRYSENIDFNRSLMTVYVNDVPIGSKTLSKDYAKADSATFYIPADLSVKGNFVVKVAFDLEIADLVCTFRQDEMPWAYVSKESTVTINSADVSSFLFDNYPDPFVKDGRMNNVAVILPASPGPADYEVLSSVLLTLGRFQKDNSGTLRVMYSSNIGDLKESNVINIGRLEQSPVVEQINNQLFFRFSPKGTTIRSNEKMLIEPNYGATLGTAQLLYSPYSTQKRALLVISGVTDNGMLKAADYLGSADNIWKVAGDGFVADSDSVYFYRFKPDNAKLILPGISQTELWPLAAVGLCVLVLLIISAVLLVGKHRRKSR